MLKTNSKTFKNRLQKHCYTAIASYACDTGEYITGDEKALCRAFWGYYLKTKNYKDNQKRYGVQTVLYSFDCFTDWLQGLPYPFKFDSYTIIEWLADSLTETETEKNAYIERYTQLEEEKCGNAMMFYHRLIFGFMRSELDKFRLND